MKASHTFRSRLLLLAAAFALLHSTGFALDPSRSVHQFLRDDWGRTRGFSGGRVHSIGQTSDGYLWIGSDSGLVRFDGIAFESVRSRSVDAQSPDHVLALLPGPAGVGLWVRAIEPTLLFYQSGTFSLRTPDPHGEDTRVTAAGRTLSGNPLFAGRRGGIFSAHASGFEVLADSSSLPASPVISIAGSNDQDVWLGTRDAGLVHLVRHTLTNVSQGLPDKSVNCLLMQPDGHVLIGTNRGAVLWDGVRIVQVPGLRTLHDPVHALLRDRDGNVWLATASGLFRLNPQGRLERLEISDSSGLATALFEDREGDLWVGGDRTLTRLRESALVAYPAPRTPPDDAGGPIYADPDGRIWWSSAALGLCLLKDDVLTPVRAPGLSREEVYTVAGADDGLWLGTKAGLTHLRRQGSSFTTQTYTESNGLAQNAVDALLQSRDGSLWAGTVNGGVSHFLHGQFTNYKASPDALLSNAIRAIVEDAEGTVWFGTPLGLSGLSGTHWVHYSGAQVLGSANINSLYPDAAGVLWIGTQNGLACLRSGRVFIPPHRPAELGAQILGMAQDRLGSLWFVTPAAILRVRRDALLEGTVGPSDLHIYGANDGIGETEIVRRDHTVTLDRAGRLWLSQTSGPAMIDPLRAARIGAPTIVHVQSLSVDGESQDVAAPLQISAQRKHIVIDFAGLNLFAPDQIRYRFRLDGIDRHWVGPGVGKEAVYVNLEPGSYRFHVQGSSGDGNWNGVEAGVSFRIVPALWQTTWFRIAAALAIALCLAALYRLRLTQISNRLHLSYEARLSERNRIARELHDTLLQSFHGLMLRFQAAQDMLPAQPELARDSLEVAMDRAEQAITEGRDAVQQLRAAGELQTTRLDQMLRVLAADLAAEYAKLDSPADPVAIGVSVEGTPRALTPLLQEDVYRISREALRNVFRHARASKIVIDIRYTQHLLRLRIRDNGIGIRPDFLAPSGRPGHWGLPGMRERARSAGGRLEIRSRPEGGAEVELSLPGTIAFVRESIPQRFRRYRSAIRDRA